MKIFTLFGFILFSLTANGSNIVSGEKLFTQPFFSVPKISPSGKHIIARLDDGDARELAIYDLEKNEKHLVIFIGKNNALQDFHWLDDDSIYVQYYLNDVARQSIIDIDLNNLAEERSAKRIKSTGYLLDPLPHLNDEVLFIRQSKKNRLEIFQIRTDDLLRDDFSRATKHPSHLNNAVSYFYDAVSDALFSLTIDKKQTSLTLWYLLQDQSDWQKLYSWSDFNHEFEPLSYLYDGKFLVLTNKETDHMAAAVFDTRSQDIIEILYEHPSFDLISAEFNLEARQLTSVSYLKHGRPFTEYLTQSGSKENEDGDGDNRGPQYLVVDVALENASAILLKYGPASPGTFMFFDASTGDTRFLEHAYPELSDIVFSVTEHFDVKTDDGSEIEALLNRPAENDNGVLLVMPHGGPIGIRDHDWFSERVQFLTNRGYTTLRVNFRGSAGYGKTFQQAGVGEFGKLIEQDITNALRVVRDKYSFNKTCTLGSSYGGYSAFMLPILHPRQYDCIVALFGIYDLPLLFSSSNFMLHELVQDSLRAVVGDNSSELSRVSPIYRLDGLSIPILLIGGLEDETAVIEHSNRVKHMLQKHGIEFESLFFRNEGHGMRSWFGEQQLHAVIDDFLRRKLSLPALETIGAADQVATEYVKISDVFNFDTLTENNQSRALPYYRKAAQLGHGRAAFNIGSLYHRGEIVDKDINEALDWYQKASETGYDSASYRLGILYEEGIEIQQDIPQAIKYYQRAVAQGFDARAGLKLAQYICTGKHVARDIELCIASLDLEAIETASLKRRKKMVTKEAVKLRKSILPNLVFSDDVSTELQSFFDKNQQAIYNAAGSDLTVNEKTYGLFEYLPNSRATEHIEKTTKIPMQKGTTFGVKFYKFNWDADTVRNLMYYRWLKMLPTGESVVVEDEFISLFKSTHLSIYYTLEETDMAPADFKLEILTIDKKPVYSKVFNVQELTSP